METTEKVHSAEIYKPIPNLLEGKVILVTGASRGIGRAVAKSYADHGATVILLARTINSLTSLANEILETKAPEPAIYPFNLATATSEDYNNLRRKLDQYFGRIDGILHNAGMLGTITPIEQFPIETWYQVLQVNLNSTFLLTQTLLPLIKRSSDASIIFTGIDSSKDSKAYWGAYSIAYAAINNFMKILADEYESSENIRFNQVVPQYINTKLNAQAYPAINPKQLLEPNDIIGAYLYLMGLDSKKLSGKTIYPSSDFLANK